MRSRRYVFIAISALLVEIISASQLLLMGQDTRALNENPSERERWRFLLRADVNGEIPHDALLKAKEQMDALRLLAPPRTDAGIANWEWLGPGNVGGRIRTILIHPTNTSTLWIGSVSGGIWRSDDGGASWSPVNDFMANLAVTSLVMDPTNPNIMYAGTGEGFSNIDAIRGAGIFRTINGGVTWVRLSSTNDFRFQWVNRLAHHPSQANTVIAATNTGVYRTTDGGGTWVSLLFPNGRATDVRYHPTNPSRILVGTSTDLYYSTDGGTTWSRETSGNANKIPIVGSRCESAFAPSSNLIYASVDRNGGELWQRANTSAGDTVWTLRNTGTNYFGGPGRSQGFYDNALWVHPLNDSIVVVGGIGLYRSTNRGQTLTNISSLHSDHHAIVNDPGFNGSSNLRVYVGHDGGIERTDNILTASQTSHWVNLNNGLGITQFYGGAAAQDGSRFIGGSQDNDIPYKLASDPPNQWRTRIGACCDGGFVAIDPSNPLRVYSETQNLYFIRSDDGGHSYVVATNGLLDANNSNLTGFIAPFSMCNTFANIVVAGGKRLWRTVDGGDTWFRIRDSIPSRSVCTAIKIGQASPNIVWAGYADGSLARTSNGGLSWTTVTPNGRPASAVTSIAINPFNTSEVFVTYGGYTTGQVFLTTDNGSTWLNRSGTPPNTIPSIQVNSIVYHPSNDNWIYVGTDLGVLASEDKGLTWNITPRFTGNEGPVNVAVDELFWQGTQYLVAATHGRGMFRARILQTVYVDINNNGFEDGTLQFPYNTIQEGINAAGNGSDISIKTGTYPQAPVTFSRRGLVISRDGTVVIRGSTDMPVNIERKR